MVFRTNPPRPNPPPTPPPLDPMRSAVRFPLSLPVRLQANGAEVNATTVDVSSTGVLFTVDRNLQVGTEVDWELHLPAEAMGTATDISVTCQGRVVWFDDTAPMRMAVVIDQYQLKELAR